jgi:Protein of unknown function, DUF547
MANTAKPDVFTTRRTALVGVFCLALIPTMAGAAGVTETFTKHTPGSTAAIDHAVWDKLLKAHVTPDAGGLHRVNYKAWKAAGHQELKTYLAGLQKVDPTTLDKAEQFAFWANLYNAITINVVLDKYPVKSIKDISLGGGLKALVAGGPWQAKTAKVLGQDLSLDDIEHNVLRAVFKDPRVHYAVNCASYGCPNLPNGAFTGANLDAALEAGAKAFINHPRGIAVDGGAVKASQIYNWFIADFGGNAEGVLSHVRKYAEPALKTKLEGITTIASHDYVWTLNDVAK